MEKILSLCGSWLLRPNRAKFEHNPVYGSTNAPLVFTKKNKKDLLDIITACHVYGFWPLYWYAIIVLVNYLTSQPSICMSSWCQALCSWDNDYTCHKIAKVHQSRVIVSLFWHMTLPHSLHNKHLCRKGWIVRQQKWICSVVVVQ